MNILAKLLLAALVLASVGYTYYQTVVLGNFEIVNIDGELEEENIEE